MFFLQEIDRKSILKAQKPIVNQAGELVTAYISDQYGPTYATLLEWIDGSTLTQNEENIASIIFKLGESVASLHEFSQTLTSLKLHRPVYNASRIDEALQELRQGTNDGALNHDDYVVIENVLSIVKEQIAELDARENAWGYVHADYQLGNIIVSEDTPALIDFGLFGYGYYLFDLGSASSMLKPELRKTLLEGYASRTSFSFDDIRRIEGQIFMDIFISYVFFIKDPEKNVWIKDHASQICSTLCRDFLHGEEVYYSV